MNFSDELSEKAKAAKTPEELIAMAKAENIELTSEQANDYFAKLNPKSGEVSDEELDNVSGGACYRPDGRLVVTSDNNCDLVKCSKCGRVGKRKVPHGTDPSITDFGHACPCGYYYKCLFCSYCSVEDGIWICNEPHNRRDYKE